MLDKSVLVLDAIEAGAGTLAELTVATGLARPTAHRLAVALETHGLLGRDATGRFVLGARLVGLGRSATQAMPLVAAARPALATLRDTTGESAQLYVRDGDRRVCLESLQSPHGLRTIVPVGAVLPLDRGSAGRVLLDEDAVVARRGWAESVAERESGVASVSAAVRDHGGQVVAAVSVSGPIQRTTRQPGRRYRDAVLAAARAVERAAGLTT